MISYQGKSVVVVGLGITGISSINYFVSQGIHPKVMDTRSDPELTKALPNGIESHLGSLQEEWLDAADLIVVSPGIDLNQPQWVKLIQMGKEIVGDVELFCREINTLKNKIIIGITGSNGKTTVTTLMGEVMKATGKCVAVAGNIGTPVLSLLNNEFDVYVLELSSFQLDTTPSFSATAATVLNVSEDHMDRYPLGLNQYQASKQKIYQHADICVSNGDDPLTLPASALKTKKVTFAFADGDYYLEPINSTSYWLCCHGERLINSNDLRLTGLHNYLNVLAVLALADAVKVNLSITLEVIRHFTGLPHRFEHVYKNQDIEWINDSKATNVGSTVAALKGLTCRGTLHLLLGGDGKAADFSPLIPFVNRPNVRLYCFGKDGRSLKALHPENAIYVETMKDAIHEIVKQTKAHDIVLLSPACASIDQFKNYEQRGLQFAQLARELG